MTVSTQLMHGALVALCAVAAVVFLRYARQTGDRFFLWFASAFATFGVNWLLLATITATHQPLVYVVRLAGFLQILAAILLKNRAAR